MLYGDFSWDKIDGGIFGSKTAESSRNDNIQKVWTRSTIPWSLHCDREVLPRAEASNIFAQRLDNLGFMEYVKLFGFVIILLASTPIVISICAFGVKKSSLLVSRAIICAIFAFSFTSMLSIVDAERV